MLSLFQTYTSHKHRWCPVKTNLQMSRITLFVDIISLNGIQLDLLFAVNPAWLV